MQKMKNFILIGLVSIGLFSSCGEYQKALKSQDVKVKYAMAEDMYNQGKYKKGVKLFDPIVNQYIGKPQGERIIYMLGDSYYKTGQYQLAAYQFERLQKLYPKSDKVVEAGFWKPNQCIWTHQNTVLTKPTPTKQLKNYRCFLTVI